MEKDLNISILNDIYGALLTPNQREMIESYYNCDLSLSEIAENCGISRQAVRDSISKGKAALERFEEILKTESKLSEIKHVLEDCLKDDDIGSIKNKLSEIIKSI